MEKVIEMLTSSLQDLHAAGLPKNILQSPDNTPLNQAYQKITSAIITLSIENMLPTK
jgi:hypothetical protein